MASGKKTLRGIIGLDPGSRTFGSLRGKYWREGCIGIDVGGTKIDGVFWRRGKVVRASSVATPKTMPRFLATLTAVVADLSQGEKVAGIGFAVAGALDRKSGKIIQSPNLPFLDGVACRTILVKQFSAPVRLENDVNCFLLAESRFGLAKDKKNVVAFILGTGSGGAILIDGQIFGGQHGAAGEFGHMVISFEQGGLDIEDLASSHGFRRLGFSDPRKAPGSVYRKIERYLGLGLANLVNVFDPELIIVGGGIVGANKFSLAPALEVMKKHTMLTSGYLPPVKVSKLPHAGALGAALLFF